MTRSYTCSWFSILLLLLPSWGNAQETSSLLWEIKKDNLSFSSYIFGTMHVRDKRAYQFHDSLLIKLKSSQVFAGELVLDKSAAKEVSHEILLPPGRELETLLSAHEYKRVKKYCRKNLGVLGLLVNRIKPVFTSAMISETLLEKDLPQALDEYLQDKAREYKLTVVGLETIEEQMKSLSVLSLEEQAKALVEQIENIDMEKKELQRMADLYASQNLDSIYSFVNSQEMQGEIGDALITNRNIVMANRLEKLLLSSSTFCAIGAAHLPGKDGVLALLLKKGFTIRPIIKK